MDEKERASVMAEWTKKWDEFCLEIVQEYGDRYKTWEPTVRH